MRIINGRPTPFSDEYINALEADPNASQWEKDAHMLFRLIAFDFDCWIQAIKDEFPSIQAAA